MTSQQPSSLVLLANFLSLKRVHSYWLPHLTTPHIPSGILVTPNIPIPSNRPIGATTFVLPLKPPHARTIGTPQVLVDGKAEDALKLEEVAFTVYYPADVSGEVGRWRQGLDWVVRPHKNTLMGYFHFGGLGPVITWLIWPLMYLYTFFIKIPVYPNAPLQTPALHSSSHSDETLTPGDGETTPQWPLVLFSHGLCGTRTTYSNLCTRLAASGRIVLAFEHRDGSAPVCMPRNPETGEAKVKLYLKPDQVIWPKNGNTEDEAHTLALRFDQLEFRKREIYLAYSAFTSFIHTGNLGDLQVIDDTTGDVRAEQIGYESWKGLVECEKDVAFVGHSFGGATVFSLLSTPPPVPYNPIPITHALALDPWLEPLPSPGPEPYVHTESASDSLVGVEKNAQCDQVKDEEKGFPPPKMLVLNSEGFSLWRVHFSRLEEVVKGWDRGRVITILRSTHVSFSDFPLLIPSFFPSSSSSTATLLSKIIGNLSVAFLEDRLYRDSGHGDDEKSGEIVDGEGLGVRERELVIEDVEWREGVAGRKWKRRMVGEVGDVVLH